MKQKLILGTAMVLLSTQAFAGEQNWELSLEAGAQRQWLPVTTFTINTVTQNNIDTEAQTNLVGGNLKAAYKLPDNTFFSGDLLGANPKISANLGYFTGSSDSSQLDASANPNSALTVDGVLGSDWGDAEWYAENTYTVADLDLTIKADQKGNLGSWSFAPEFGFAGRYFEQDYDLDRSAARTNVHDGDLDTFMYGGLVGFSLNSPSYNGWMLSINPSVKMMVASSDMSVVQDKDGVIGGTYVDGLTVKDSETSMVYEGKLQFGIAKQIDNVAINFNLFGTATSGTPYIDMPEYSGDAAKISTGKASYAAGAKLGLTISF